MRRIVQILRDAGAKEVHLRISSPPYMYPCYFGIDTPSRKDLLASSNSVDEICKAIGADSIGYLSLEGLLKTPVGTKCGFCSACFTGDYPMEVPKEGSRYFCGRSE
jgi:amidophosphoribosyltransferase